MVDIEGVYLGSQTIQNSIQNMLYSESSDSGIVSDYNSDGDNVSMAEEVDYSKRLHEAMREIMVRQNDVCWSRHYSDLPCHRIIPPRKEIHVAATGPSEGIKNITLEPTSSSRNSGCEPFGGWTKPDPRAYGIGTTLYDCNPVTNCTSGDPVADVFAVVAGKNSCILALADGVNWGEKSRLAARCAVAGCLQYLNNHIFAANTTRDIMSILLRAFEHAQECIIEKNATMTTLCVAVVCQLEASGRWGLCVVNVGDSLAFTYRQGRGVQEVTIGSHYEIEERDMRCPGGSLGPCDGYNPDLRNLTFSFTTLDPGDIVFLTSDGVSDNFDPVIAQCQHCLIPDLRRTNSLDSMLDEISRSRSRLREDSEGSMSYSSRSDQDILRYRAYDLPITRHKKMLDDMTQVIQEEGLEEHNSAMEVCAKLLSHVCRCTAKKRSFLEQVDREDHNLIVSNREFRRARDREISRHMRDLPGKLDHAAVVAFEVGLFSTPEPLRLVSGRQANGRRRRSLFNVFSEFRRNVVDRRRASVDVLAMDQNEISSSSDSFTELYSLFGN